MLAINQFNLHTGVYRHNKEPQGLYVLKSIVTHEKIEGVWTKMQDPLVIYEPLGATYESINGGPTTMVQKAFAEPLSDFKNDFTFV